MTAPVVSATGDWVADALCAQVGGELFHPDKGESPAAAKRICGKCAVQRECLRWAVETGARDGVLGGMSPRQRRGLTVADVDAMPPVEVVDQVIPRGRPIPVVVPSVRPRPMPETRPVPDHDHDDQAPAPVPVKKTRAKVAACGTTGGYSRHKKAGEEACEPCKQANRDYQSAWYRAKHPVPEPEPKPAVRVLWLVPAHPGAERLEYATLSWSATHASKWSPISPETAAILMGQGEEVHVRTVTTWQPITGGAR